jgi:CheY-like chemotaxis protein
MSFEEIMAALRSLPAYRTLPVIVFSSFDEREGQRQSAKYGADAFVSKPDDLQATFDAIHAIVRRWVSQQNDQLHPR